MISSFAGKHEFLSNFFPCSIEHEGIVYPSAENAFQACKTLHREARQQFAGVGPGLAKKLGRNLRLRPDWEEIKLAVMYEVVDLKFHDWDLCERLLDTGEHELVEGNDWGDVVWGCTWDYERKLWIGENRLGKILMIVRNEVLPF